MKKIKVGKNKFALIDKEDFENINQNSWHIHKTKTQLYAVRGRTKGEILSKKCGGKMIKMHRVILLPQILSSKEEFVVHHINLNGLDNRKKNLLLLTKNEHSSLHGYLRNRCKRR
jgi:hypothetical protein